MAERLYKQTPHGSKDLGGGKRFNILTPDWDYLKTKKGKTPGRKGGGGLGGQEHLKWLSDLHRVIHTSLFRER